MQERMIVYSQMKPVSFDDFVKHYQCLVEERTFSDFDIYKSYDFKTTHQKLLDVFANLKKMFVEPIRFLNYVFEISDEIPIPEKLGVCLKYYKNEGKYRKTYFDKIDYEIDKVVRFASVYPSLEELYFHEKINPFLPIFDDRVILYMKRNKLPKNLELWDGGYFDSLYCAVCLIEDFGKLRFRLVTHWKPVLKELKEVKDGRMD